MYYELVTKKHTVFNFSGGEPNRWVNFPHPDLWLCLAMEMVWLALGIDTHQILRFYHWNGKKKQNKHMPYSLESIIRDGFFKIDLWEN